MDTIISKLVISSDVMIITGDTNVRLDRPADAHSVSFAQVLTNYQLCQRVTEPTHSLGGTLDIVITREDYSLADLDVVYVLFSDHSLVKWKLKFTKPDIGMKTVKTRKWKSFDHDAFLADPANTFPDAEIASANAENIGDVKCSCRVLRLNDLTFVGSTRSTHGRDASR
jgi:hypothetical protein